jgi:hypothetical protein
LGSGFVVVGSANTVWSRCFCVDDLDQLAQVLALGGVDTARGQRFEGSAISSACRFALGTSFQLIESVEQHRNAEHRTGTTCRLEPGEHEFMLHFVLGASPPAGLVLGAARLRVCCARGPNPACPGDSGDASVLVLLARVAR